MKQPEVLQSLLESFVVLDCPLRHHPKVWAVAHLAEENLLLTVAATGRAKQRILGHRFPLRTTISGLLLRDRLAVGLSEWPVENSPLPEFGGYLTPSILAAPIGETSSVGTISILSGESGLLDNQRGLLKAMSYVLAYEILHLGKNRRFSAEASQLGSFLKEIRLERGFTQTKVAQLAGTSRISVSRWEAGDQPPTRGPLRRWCEALGLVSSEGPTLVTSVDITPEILAILRETPERLKELSPQQFENLVANRLDRMGFDVKLTGNISTRDGGIDIIATPKLKGLMSFVLAAQVKHHRAGAKTGRPEVDRLLAWKQGPFQAGLLVTNTAFTRDALWLAAQGGNSDFLRLRDFEDLRRWLQNHFWSEADWREIPGSVELTPGVTIDVPRTNLEKSSQVWPFIESYKDLVEERITHTSSGRASAPLR